MKKLLLLVPLAFVIGCGGGQKKEAAAGADAPLPKAPEGSPEWLNVDPIGATYAEPVFEGAPEWLMVTNGMFEEEGHKGIWAVGWALKDEDQGLSEQKACTQVLHSIGVLMPELAPTFTETKKCNNNEGGVYKQECEVPDCATKESWTDPSTGTTFTMAQYMLTEAPADEAEAADEEAAE